MSEEEKQEKFIWLAFAELVPYKEIANRLELPGATLTKWTNELRPRWEPLAKVRALSKSKKIQNFENFYNWFINHPDKSYCHYCKITEVQIAELRSRDKLYTKRFSTRGMKLELDRKDPSQLYDNTDNIVFCCYWCNNAKTDTFTHDEFLEVGKSFEKIWKQRLTSDN